MPDDAVAPPAGDNRSTVSVLRRFLVDRAAALDAMSLDEPRGESCGVPIGVAAVRVMTGADGQAGASTELTGRDGKTAGTTTKDSEVVVGWYVKTAGTTVKDSEVVVGWYVKTAGTTVKDSEVVVCLLYTSPSPRD